MADLVAPAALEAELERVKLLCGEGLERVDWLKDQLEEYVMVQFREGLDRVDELKDQLEGKLEEKLE